MKKNVILLCCMFAISLSSVAQTSKLLEVQKKVAATNSKLPLKTRGGATIESMKIENGFVVQRCSSASMYDSNGRSSSRSYGESFLEQAKSESARAMYKDYLEAGLGVKLVMFFKDVKKTETITLEPSDLKRMLSYPVSAYSQLLNELRVGRNNLPMAAGDGLTCISYETPRYEFVFLYEVDESLYLIDALQKNLNKNKFKLLHDLSIGKSDLYEMAKICANAGFGLGMKYIGKSSVKTAEMTITYEELKVCFE